MNSPDTVTDQSASAANVIACVACKHPNVTSAKFCAGCGHGLYEPCSGCSEQVRLDQKFCGSCGTNLEAGLQQQRQQLEKWMTRAIESAKQHKYEDASSLLERVAEHQDFRLQDLANNASQALKKVRALQSQANTGASERVEAATRAAGTGDHAKVVQLLQSVPANLLSRDASAMLAKSQSFLQQVTELRGELQTSIDAKRWSDAGAVLQQLLELVPGDAKYTKLAGQAAAKLIKSATRRLARQDYDGAADQLAAVPDFCRGEEYAQTARQVHTAAWLSSQFKNEPYATATLGRLAVRFAKEAPTDGRAAGLVKELQTKLKAGSKDQRIASPPFHPAATSWLGGDVAMFAAPRSIDCSDAPEIRRRPGRFCTAMGLALQGLGLTRISQRFGGKKGLLSAIGSRAKTACWGIDIGTAGIHAVLLRKEKSNDRPVIVSTYHADFETPTIRGGSENREPLTIKAAVETFLEQVDVNDASVLVNFSSSSVVSRFLNLPPVKDKQAAKMMELEASQQIPISISDLDLVTWIAELDPSSSIGRPTLIAAAKKSLIQSRIDVLASAGLKVDGLQSETIALANFAAYEFADQLTANDDADESAKTPTVAIVDAGASSTRLLMVSAESLWYWSIDSGSEELTSVLARMTKQTKDEAEASKRNPAGLAEPQKMYEPIEHKLDELRGRLTKIADQALQSNDRFDVQQTWCVGGACQTHAWIRRVLLEKP